MPEIIRLVGLAKFSAEEIVNKALRYSAGPYEDASYVDWVVNDIYAWTRGAGMPNVQGYDDLEKQAVRNIIWAKIEAARNAETAKGKAQATTLEAKYSTSDINNPFDFSKTQLISPSAKYVAGGQLGNMVPVDRNYDNAYDAYLADYYNAFDIAYCDANAPNGVWQPGSDNPVCNIGSDQYATTELKLQDFDLPLIKFDKPLKDVMFYLYKQNVGLTEEGLNTDSGLNGGVPTPADTIYYRSVKTNGKLNDAQWETLSKWFKGMIRFKVMSPRVFVEQLYFPRLTNQLMQKNGLDYNTSHDQALAEMDIELPGVKKKILQSELKKLTEQAGEIKDTDAGWTDYCATISGYATLSTDLQKLFAEQNPDLVAKCNTFNKSTNPTDAGIADPSNDPNNPDSKSNITRGIIIVVVVVVVLAVGGWVIWKFTRNKGA